MLRKKYKSKSTESFSASESSNQFSRQASFASVGSSGSAKRLKKSESTLKKQLVDNLVKKHHLSKGDATAQFDQVHKKFHEQILQVQADYDKKRAELRQQKKTDLKEKPWNKDAIEAQHKQNKESARETRDLQCQRILENEQQAVSQAIANYPTSSNISNANQNVSQSGFYEVDLNSPATLYKIDMKVNDGLKKPEEKENRSVRRNSKEYFDAPLLAPPSMIQSSRNSDEKNIVSKEKVVVYNNNNENVNNASATLNPSDILHFNPSTPSSRYDDVMTSESAETPEFRDVGNKNNTQQIQQVNPADDKKGARKDFGKQFDRFKKVIDQQHDNQNKSKPPFDTQQSRLTVNSKTEHMPIVPKAKRNCCLRFFGCMKAEQVIERQAILPADEPTSQKVPRRKGYNTFRST